MRGLGGSAGSGGSKGVTSASSTGVAATSTSIAFPFPLPFIATVIANARDEDATDVERRMVEDPSAGFDSQIGHAHGPVGSSWS